MAQLWEVRILRGETTEELAARLTQLRNESFVPHYTEQQARLHGTRSRSLCTTSGLSHAITRPALLLGRFFGFSFLRQPDEI
jgi:hypothetical protein